MSDSVCDVWWDGVRWVAGVDCVCRTGIADSCGVLGGKGGKGTERGRRIEIPDHTSRVCLRFVCEVVGRRVCGRWEVGGG